MKSIKNTFLKEVALVICDTNLEQLLYAILQALDYAVIKIANKSDTKILKKFIGNSNFSNYICITDYETLNKFTDIKKFSNVLCIYTAEMKNLPIIEGKYISTDQLTIKEFRKILNNEMV